MKRKLILIPLLLPGEVNTPNLDKLAKADDAASNGTGIIKHIFTDSKK